MTNIDMGRIEWPVVESRAATASAPTVGSAKLDRGVAYTGNVVQITATGTDGQPHPGPLEVVLRERSGDELRRTVNGGVLILAGIPAGRYRVTVGGVNAGPLAVL